MQMMGAEIMITRTAGIPVVHTLHKPGVGNLFA